MAKKLQTAIGGTITVPANDTAKIVHESDGGEWVNIVEFIGSASGLEMDVYVQPESGPRIPLVTTPDDGPDQPDADDYPLSVPTGTGSRFLTLVRLDSGDQLVWKIENTTAADETVTSFASAAGTLDIALSNGGA